MKVFVSLGIALLFLVMGSIMAPGGPAQASTLAPDAPQTIRDTLSHAHAGDMDSMHQIATYLIGKSVTDGEQMAEYAFGWSLLAARKGHAQAAELTGMMYRNGIGVTQNYVKSRKWLERALARGSNEPNFELAILYADDNNPGVDKVKASSLLTEAIKTGEPRACLIAARMKLDEGIELRRMLDELNCAADGNIAEAMELLADYNLTKRSPFSDTRARKWLEKALMAGSPDAAGKLAEFDSQ